MILFWQRLETDEEASKRLNKLSNEQGWRSGLGEKIRVRFSKPSVDFRSDLLFASRDILLVANSSHHYILVVENDTYFLIWMHNKPENQHFFVRVRGSGEKLYQTILIATIRVC